MTFKPDPSCTYHSGDETCFRPDCRIVCVRNYRDALDCDIPAHANGKKAEKPAPSWWQSHFAKSGNRLDR